MPESLEKERVEFVPLALLDSVESSEVSYPSVALSLDQVHIAYTYKRAYIKSLVLSKSALVRQAQEVLKRKAQAESSSLSLQATAPAAKQSIFCTSRIHTINGRALARNPESVVGGLGAKGVKKEGGIRRDASQVAPPSPLGKNSSQTKLESSYNAKKVESSVDSKETSAIAERYPLFSKETAHRLFSKETTLCHADKSARNDKSLDSSAQARLPRLKKVRDD